MFPDRPILKMVIRYSLFALVANLVYFLVNRIDYWFVEYYCSQKDLGNYIQASKIAQMLVILPAILGSTLFPLFSSQEKSGSQVPVNSCHTGIILVKCRYLSPDPCPSDGILFHCFSVLLLI